MSDADKRGTTPTSIPEWQAELWSYVGQGDSLHCPLHDRCPTVQNGQWCPDEGRESLQHLLDVESFNARDFDFMQAEGSVQCRLVLLLEGLGQEFLRKGNVHRPPVPTEIIELFDQEHDVEIHQLPLKAHRGAIWYHKGEWIIQVKDSDAIPTMRFTIFHEAFHILAHCNTTPVFKKQGSIAGIFNEWLADSFAAFTMMPREWVKERWAEVNDVDKMAEIFAIPKAHMFLRLRQLGLV